MNQRFRFCLCFQNFCIEYLNCSGSVVFGFFWRRDIHFIPHFQIVVQIYIASYTLRILFMTNIFGGTSLHMNFVPSGLFVNEGTLFVIKQLYCIQCTFNTVFTFDCKRWRSNYQDGVESLLNGLTLSQFALVSSQARLLKCAMN